MKPSKTVIPSKEKYIKGNYVILNNNKDHELGDNFQEEIEEDKNEFRIKPSKNIVAFIRRKHLNHIKEQQHNQ